LFSPSTAIKFAAKASDAAAHALARDMRTTPDHPLSVGGAVRRFELARRIRGGCPRRISQGNFKEGDTARSVRSYLTKFPGILSPSRNVYGDSG
jgi:hypothetical protein